MSSGLFCESLCGQKAGTSSKQRSVLFCEGKERKNYEYDLLLFKGIELYREKKYAESYKIFQEILSAHDDVDPQEDPQLFAIRVKAKFYRACMLFHGNGVPKDIKASNALFKTVWKEMRLVSDDDDDKLFYLARMKDEGWGTRVNKREALIYYIRSTSRPGIDRNAIAFFNLGLMYYLGEGVHKSLDKTRQMYAIASSMGHMSATYNLAVMCRDGVGGPRDPDEALRLFLLNAKRGEVKSMNSFALMQKHTHPKECIYWLTKAIEKGNAYAMYNFASFLERGELGMEPDLPAAIMLYRRAAEAGHIASMEHATHLMKELTKRMCIGNL